MTKTSLVVDGSGAWQKHMAYVASTPPREVGLTVREVLECPGRTKVQRTATLGCSLG